MVSRLKVGLVVRFHLFDLCVRPVLPSDTDTALRVKKIATHAYLITALN